MTLRWKPNRDNVHEIEFVLDVTVDAPDLAAEIARRAARYSLAVSPEFSDDQRTKIETMLQAPPIKPSAPKKIRWQLMPSYHFENNKSARYGLG